MRKRGRERADLHRERQRSRRQLGAVPPARTETARHRDDAEMTSPPARLRLKRRQRSLGGPRPDETGSGGLAPWEPQQTVTEKWGPSVAKLPRNGASSCWREMSGDRGQPLDGITMTTNKSIRMGYLASKNAVGLHLELRSDIID